MLIEPVRDRHGIREMVLEARTQRPQAALSQIDVIGSNRQSEVTARPVYHRPMDVTTRHASHNNVGMTADIFTDRLNGDVGAMVQRLEVKRC